MITKTAYAVLHRPREVVGAGKGKYKEVNKKEQIQYGEFGQGDCCCFEPEEAFSIFKTKRDAIDRMNSIREADLPRVVKIKITYNK